MVIENHLLIVKLFIVAENPGCLIPEHLLLNIFNHKFREVFVIL